ncbi:MAG: glycosyltransferase [Deltaproteobacteria bacterium]|nr:glycosyltransferase [Deltaproteobacteria bacterium]
MKISVITPCYNSGNTLDRAIKSVLCQDYHDYEHIIVDGVSTDHTPEILRQYSHLKWVSEPDNGQVEAMNKGFLMAIGDVIVYLNADDYFLEGAFSSVIPHFRMGEDVVMGKVLVRSQEADGTREWINDPKTDVESMLYHWEADAFCVNPVGYFYRRAVQKEIPFNEENDDKQDLEFLIEVASRYRIKKIDSLLGVFNLKFTTKTGREQLTPSYWRNDNFSFIDRTVKKRSREFQSKFRIDQERGYQLRRRWAVRDGFKMGFGDDLIDKGEAFFLPRDENNSHPERCNRIAPKGGWVVPVLSMDEDSSSLIYATLKSLPQEVLPAEVYNIRQEEKRLFPWLPMSSNAPFSHSLKTLFNEHRNDLSWKFIIGIGGRLSCFLSRILEQEQHGLKTKSIMKKICRKIYTHKYAWFDEQLKKGFGINISEHQFENRRGYSIIKTGDIGILLYRTEILPQIFSKAMEDFFGIPYLRLRSRHSLPRALLIFVGMVDKKSWV